MEMYSENQHGNTFLSLPPLLDFQRSIGRFRCLISSSLNAELLVESCVLSCPLCLNIVYQEDARANKGQSKPRKLHSVLYELSRRIFGNVSECSSRMQLRFFERILLFPYIVHFFRGKVMLRARKKKGER